MGQNSSEWKKSSNHRTKAGEFDSQESSRGMPLLADDEDEDDDRSENKADDDRADDELEAAE
jgi:hypothetical protein